MQIWNFRDLVWHFLWKETKWRNNFFQFSVNIPSELTNRSPVRIYWTHCISIARFALRWWHKTESYESQRANISSEAIVFDVGSFRVPLKLVRAPSSPKHVSGNALVYVCHLHRGPRTGNISLSMNSSGGENIIYRTGREKKNFISHPLHSLALQCYSLNALGGINREPCTKETAKSTQFTSL